jgi:hypothetical protein
MPPNQWPENADWWKRSIPPKTGYLLFQRTLFVGFILVAFGILANPIVIGLWLWFWPIIAGVSGVTLLAAQLCCLYWTRRFTVKSLLVAVVGVAIVLLALLRPHFEYVTDEPITLIVDVTAKGDGRPVNNALVTVLPISKNEADERLLSLRTDANGRAILPILVNVLSRRSFLRTSQYLRLGHRVEVHAIGYRSANLTLDAESVRTNGELHQRIVLLPDSQEPREN